MNKIKRIELIDFLRGCALLAMAVYHFSWDLEFFGYSPPGTTAQGGWKLFARGIATSFLFLVGISLYLAHKNNVQIKPFLKRFGMVAIAAAAISLATWIVVPDAFIFFGILHQIALASVLGLLFLRLPNILIITSALFIIVLPIFFRSQLFDHPFLWWVGLSLQPPVSNDYVPLFPWFGAVLAGVAFAKWAYSDGLIDKAAGISLPGWSQPLQFAGRHSLAVYLLHQPLLIGGLWIFAQIMPATSSSSQMIFEQACNVQCEETHEKSFCKSYCGCVITSLNEEALFNDVYAGTQSADETKRLNEIVAQCSFDSAKE